MIPGDKVRVRTYKRRPGRWNSRGLMDKYMGKTVTIKSVNGDFIGLVEDNNEWFWRKEDFDIMPYPKTPDSKFDLPDELFEI